MTDYWQKDYQRAKNLVVQIADDIQRRDASLTSASSSKTSRGEVTGKGKQTAAIRGQLAQLGQEITQLQQSLITMSANPKAYGINSIDLQKKKELINSLQDRREELLNAFKSSFMTNPFSGGMNAYNSENNFFYSQGMESSSLTCTTTSNSENFSNLSYAELIRKQEEIMQHQDEQLEYLEGSVHNLKDLGNNINEEVTLHHRLLSDIEQNADNTNRQLSRNRRALTRLMKKASNMWLILTIIILLVILICLLIYFL